MIQHPPNQDLGIFVVVPAYNESSLDDLLQSLKSCYAPESVVEVLILINEHRESPPEVRATNQALFEDLHLHANHQVPQWLSIEVIYQRDLPRKHAGVGLARKLAMDEGLRRFRLLEREGLIVNIDADCTCARNYFQEIEAHFCHHPNSWAAGLHFEHCLDTTDIVDYELHLRYFIQAQRHARLPFAFQTLGSCMVVRSEAYSRMGGMNKRQAGEDFYFLQKFIEIGRFSEIYTTTVFPSARTSDRVPFGTGKAIADIRLGNPQKTYQLVSILSLRSMVESLNHLYEGAYEDWSVRLDPALVRFLDAIGASDRIEQIRSHTATINSFKQKYLQWFNAFRVMKYLHWVRDVYPDRSVFSEASRFYLICQGQDFEGSTKELLLWYRARAIERQG